MGNIISSLSSVYAIAHQSDRIPIFYLKENVNGVHMREIFPNIGKFVYLVSEEPNMTILQDLSVVFSCMLVVQHCAATLIYWN